MVLAHPDGHRTFPMSAGMVISDDCEDTKAKKWGEDYFFSVAPLRELSQFDTGHGEPGTIRAGALRALFYLPANPPLGREWAVDLRLAQPFTYAELLGARLLTSIGPTTKAALKYALTRFFTGSEPKPQP